MPSEPPWETLAILAGAELRPNLGTSHVCDYVCVGEELCFREASCHACTIIWAHGASATKEIAAKKWCELHGVTFDGSSEE